MKYLKSMLIIMCILLLLSGCKKECVHNYQPEITENATCTQEGTQVFTCTLCKEFYTVPIPVAEHVFEEGVVEKEPSCEENGIFVQYCANCEASKTEDIPASGHVYGEGYVVLESTCGQAGSMEYACIICNGIKTEEIETLAHTLGEPATTKEPNCTELGEISAVCTVCGASEVVDTIATNDEHSFENTVQRAPTCTDPGAGTNTCIRCGYAEACTYDLAAHSYGAQKTTAQPTCTKSGSAQAVCTVCGHTDKRKIDATGHTWDQEKCNATVTCTVCGYKNSEGVGHKYELDHASKPTSSTIGTRWYVCKNCGKSKMEYYWDKGTISLSKLESDIAKYAKKCGFNVVSSKSPDAKQSAHIYVPFYMVVWDDSLSPVVEAGEYGIDGVCSRVEDPSAHDVYIEVKFHSSSLVEQFIVNVYYL